jgi:starvation-inducible DNA-binding protein
MITEANIGIPEPETKKVALLLNTLLADEFVLYTKTRNYHWNVQGMHFHSLHLFFEDQYDELAEMIDTIAERTRALGHFALGTMKDFLEITRLLEDNDVGDEKTMLNNLLNDHETVIRELRNDQEKAAEIHDPGTSDFLTAIMEKHEKMAWMIRSHLE